MPAQTCIVRLNFCGNGLQQGHRSCVRLGRCANERAQGWQPVCGRSFPAEELRKLSLGLLLKQTPEGVLLRKVTGEFSATVSPTQWE